MNWLDKYSDNVPQAQKGKTIYVESENDPRYRAYQDSLKAYNSSMNLKKQVEKTKQFPDVATNNKTTFPITGESESMLPKTRLEKFMAHPDSDPRRDFSKYNEGTGKSMKPVDVLKYPSSKWYSLEAGTLPIYKKPTQPVEVRKEKPIVEDTLPKTSPAPYIEPRPTLTPLNLQPKEIQNVQNKPQASDIEPLPQGRVPKYLNVVDKVNQNFGGTETQYRWSPNQGELRQLSDKTYPDGTPYNTRTITPQYQNGGQFSGTTNKGFNYNGAWGGQFQMGGNIYPVNYVPKAQDGTELSEYDIAMRGMMKSKIGMGNAFNHPAIKRMSQAMPKTGMTPEGIGTHYMSSVDNYAVPELQDLGEEELTLIDPNPRSREAIRFNSPEEAQYFAENYKDVAPMSTTFKGLQEYAMGGSLPGSVGFTYARTKGIPSEGPYAKKTLPSAQDGTNVDFDYVNYGTPEYKEAYEQGKFANVPNPLDEVVVTPYDKKYPFYQSLSPEERKYINDPSPIGRQIRARATDGEGFNSDKAEQFAMGLMRDLPLSALQAPQSAFVEGVEAIRGNEYNFLNAIDPSRQRVPSETLGFDTKDLSWYNPKSIANFAMDVSMDPSNIVGAGLVDDALKLGLKNIPQKAGKALGTESGLLSNTWRLNPKAYQYNLPENTMWRGIGKEGMEDAIQSGVFRPKNTSNTKKTFTTSDGTEFNFGKSFDKTYYSPDFKIADRYGKNYIAEVPKTNADFTRRYSNKDWSYHTNREIPISEGRILQKDWLQGYKEVPKQLPNSGNIDDVGNIFKGHLTDKEKEMYQWFEKQQKLDTLPNTKNKKTLGVLEDFKTRIQTPEGKKRMKELGIDSDEMLQKIQIVEDSNTFGYFSGDRNRAVLNPLDPLPTQTARHEIEHGVQNVLRRNEIDKAVNLSPTEKLKALESGKSSIDDLLSGLELRKQGTLDKQWRGHVDNDSPVDISEFKSLISNKQNATDYFLTGSEGREKSAFLGEVQQYMMDNNIIPKTSYTEVTPEMVKNTFVDAMFDESGGGKYLRLFNIMKPTDANYKLISEGLNKMLGLVPPAAIIGAGATQLGNEENAPQYQQGGNIKQDNMGYWNPDNWGEVVEIDSNDITMKGVYEPLIGISDTGDTKLMQPGKDYKFKGKKVTEYPLAKNGKELVKLNQLTNFTNYNTKQSGGWLDKYSK